MTNASFRKIAVFIRVLRLLLFLLCALSTYLAAAVPEKPAIAVFLEKSDVRENDSVRVRFQVSNDGPVKISASQITIVSPGNFMRWYCGGCEADQGKLVSVLDLGPIDINQAVDREAWFHIQPNIPVGQFNLLFRLETTVASTPPKRSVALAEKTITVKLLGTDTLGGIPLALSGLILPGFCFWMVLSLFGVKWSFGLALGDKIVYSVLISLALLFIFTSFSFADISSGLSIKKLFIWGASGAGAGVLVGGWDWGRRWLRQKREKAITLEPLDDEQLVFRKLLLRYADKEKPLSKVVLKNNKEYYGSLVYKDSEKTTLVGWYELGKNAAAAIGDSNDRKAFRQAILTRSTALNQRDGIRVLKDGLYQDTLHWLFQWNNGDVLHAEILKSGWKFDPLELV